MLVPLPQVTLHYDTLGPADGVPVLLVHALGADGGMWVDQVPALLDAGYRVLRLDLSGHGGSGLRPGPHSMEDLSDDIAGFVRALDIGPVHYVGLSLGGMAGQGLAIRAPDCLRSLMTCDALPAALPNAAAIWGPRIAAVQAAGSCAGIADATMDRWLTPAWRAANPQLWRQIRDTVAATHPQGYIGCAQAISGFDFVPLLPSVRVPVLSLCGADDPAVPPSEGRRIAALVPGGRFVDIPGAMHFPNLEAPDLFNRVLLDWLAAQD